MITEQFLCKAKKKLLEAKCAFVLLQTLDSKTQRPASCVVDYFVVEDPKAR